jgi:hypothetical protein
MPTPYAFRKTHKRLWRRHGWGVGGATVAQAVTATGPATCERRLARVVRAGGQARDRSPGLGLAGWDIKYNALGSCASCACPSLSVAAGPSHPGRALPLALWLACVMRKLKQAIRLGVGRPGALLLRQEAPVTV